MFPVIRSFSEFHRFEISSFSNYVSCLVGTIHGPFRFILENHSDFFLLVNEEVVRSTSIKPVRKSSEIHFQEIAPEYLIRLNLSCNIYLHCTVDIRQLSAHLLHMIKSHVLKTNRKSETAEEGAVQISQQ